MLRQVFSIPSTLHLPFVFLPTHAQSLVIFLPLNVNRNRSEESTQLEQDPQDDGHECFTPSSLHLDLEALATQTQVLLDLVPSFKNTSILYGESSQSITSVGDGGVGVGAGPVV